MDHVKILVAADRPVIGESLAAAVAAAMPGVGVIPTENTGEALISRLDDMVPDVVIVDLDLPVAASRALCGQVRAYDVPVVFLAEDAAEAVGLLQASADGVLAPDEGLDGVVSAVRTVLEGGVYVAPSLLTDVLRVLLERGGMAGVRGGADALGNLTEREREVLTLLADGSDVAGIARDLCISPETAKTHIRHVLHKLGVRSRLEAVAVAAGAGLVAGRARS